MIDNYYRDLLDAYCTSLGVTKEAREAGRYEYITSDAERFIRTFKFATNISRLVTNNTHPVKFLDIGAGLGEKMELARRALPSIPLKPGVLDRDVPDVWGLEINDTYLTLASPYWGERIFKADAVSYSFYSTYDILYFYKPCQDGQMQGRLEYHVWKYSSPNVVLISPLYTTLYPNDNWIVINGDDIFDVFLKKEHADFLNDLAGATAGIDNRLVVDMSLRDLQSLLLAYYDKEMKHA